MAKTSAREKLAAKKQIKKVVLEKQFGGIKAGETMFVATPSVVDAYIREIPHGASQTIPEMRDALAAREGCAGTCPMSTSIFVRMVAEAALEDLQDGKTVSEVSPFWRVLTSADKITKRLKIDPAWIDEQRQLEAG
ncbi:MAG: hypothetical protein AAFP81_10445 [Pseudomonadota bacterium]